MDKLKVLAYPAFAGKHARHDNRFIATVDAEFLWEWEMKSGSIIAVMENGEHQVEYARLFAAAPELLAALEEIADGCIPRAPGHVDFCRTMTKEQIAGVARAAIAKAKGE